MSENRPQDRYSELDTIKTRFWAPGKSSSPVLLMHGLGDPAENWLQNIDAVAKKHRLYTIAFPGFGRSDKPVAPDSVPFPAQAIPEFPGAQGINCAAIAGNSLGGAKGSFVRSALDSARQIGCPTLVIWAKEDKLLPLKHVYKTPSVTPTAAVCSTPADTAPRSNNPTPLRPLSCPSSRAETSPLPRNVRVYQIITSFLKEQDRYNLLAPYG